MFSLNIFLPTSAAAPCGCWLAAEQYSPTLPLLLPPLPPLPALLARGRTPSREGSSDFTKTARGSHLQAHTADVDGTSGGGGGRVAVIAPARQVQEECNER